MDALANTCPRSAFLPLSLTEDWPPRSPRGHGVDDVIATLTFKWPTRIVLKKALPEGEAP